MALCTSSPTLTSTGVRTTQSVSTTITTHVTTPPGSVITTFVGTCSTVSNSTICGTATRVLTQTGTPFTTVGQVAVTVNVPVAYTTTLYGSSCSSVPGNSYPVSISPVVSTITSSSIYTSDGSTYITVLTSLSSAAPAEPTSASPDQSSTSNSNIPAIVGGVVGGLSLLALLAIVAWKFFKKPPISFDKEDYNGWPKQEQGSPPYHYSAIGPQVVANDARLQPGYRNDTTFNNGVAAGDAYAGATSNAVGPTATGNDPGLQPGISRNDLMYNVPNHGPVHQFPVTSLTPFVAGAAGLAGAALPARPNSIVSSTAHMPGPDPIGQQITYSPGMSYVRHQSYSSGLAPYPQQQPYVPPPLQDQRRSPLSHNLSVGSSVATSSGAIGSTGPGGYIPAPMISPPQVFPQLQPSQQFIQQSYGESLSASQSVSSAGPLDTQVLQVRNPGLDTLVQDSSTTFGTPGRVERPSSSTSSPPLSDGKGRPLDTQGEMLPIVHLDGGAYGESSHVAPPAYRE